MTSLETSTSETEPTVILPAESTDTGQELQQNVYIKAEQEEESVPEDLKDFVVLDEAEITDSENESVDSNGETIQWDCPAHLLAPRTYSDKDFSPTTLDPRCKPDWPLAAFWPVYVGNFRLYRRHDGDYNCTHAVHKYFASKGIPAFMVFRRKDTFFEEYQKRVGFYDMLVYFCCEKDANRAVQWCHRDRYYGHHLNVCNGRTPDFFPKRKSWRFEHMIVEDKLESETSLEHYLRQYDGVKYVSKQDLDGVFVQFYRVSRHGFSDAFLDDERFLAIPIDDTVRKQRFIEQDVEDELRKKIAENEKFMRLRPKRHMLESLKHGVIPPMRRLWEQDEIENYQFTHAGEERQRFQRKRHMFDRFVDRDDMRPFIKHSASRGKWMNHHRTTAFKHRGNHAAARDKRKTIIKQENQNAKTEKDELKSEMTDSKTVVKDEK
ncbi:uncharacterized protein LOC129778171 isoform X2 [Toxorhynchites rutilus septentrionalis]|uniref:uncharacterized protein LOC129778171 isoform X2 n=1 Tax=Toxorhynchites rutilus septentrionalis TaxID=329112 RepID=UPI0024789642|nr:uncharacterized protein LOC129778171 isoform X2 [Toxorhynchites rutilus septentrionalis]